MRAARFAAAASALTFAYCGVAAYEAAPVWELAFRSDRSPVAWLSSALLLANAVLAARLAVEGGLPRSLGIGLTLALLLLAFDEQFMWHERWKFGCGAWLEVCRTSALVRELPMLLVGTGGAIGALWLQRALPDRATRVCLWFAIAVGLWAIATDQFEMPDAIARLEEGFEVWSEALFLGVLMSVGRR